MVVNDSDQFHIIEFNWTYISSHPSYASRYEAQCTDVIDRFFSFDQSRSIM